jgi:hypothetical protein
MSWGHLRIAAGACALAIILALGAWSSGADAAWRLGGASQAKMAVPKPSGGGAQTSNESDAELPGGVSRSTLEAIAACESGGDPTSVSADGAYRGKYQFDRGAWASVGGDGDPAAAPEPEQDRRAALLYVRSGATAWPNCG